MFVARRCVAGGAALALAGLVHAQSKNSVPAAPPPPAIAMATASKNPARASDIALDVTVDAKPFYAPIVYTITPEGPQSLDVAQYPEARFVSAALLPNGAGRALISGQSTLMGVTKPVTINAGLVGVGKWMEGAPTIGFTGSMVVDTAQFTQQPKAKMVGKVTVILDAEFIRS